METKKAGKQPTVSRTTMEFVITISISIIAFLIIEGTWFFDWIYSLQSYQHAELHKLLFFGLFFAAAMAVFALRRWLELRKAYKRLAQSEEKLRFQSELLDKIGDGITATDLEGKITYVNQAQCSWVKKNKDELKDKSAGIYDVNDTIDLVQNEIIKTTREKGKWSGEITNITPDGNKITLECHTWLMKDKNGKPFGLCGVARNITERIERQQEILRHKRYLEALDEAAGILLNSISEVKYKEFLVALGAASGADRAIVFLKKIEQNGKLSMPIRAQWNANESVVALTESSHNYFIQNVWPNWEKTLVSDKPVCIITSNSPAKEREFWNSLNIKSLLTLPIIIDGSLEGFISFDNCTEYRQWTPSEIEFLHTAAKDLASAIKRLQIKKELKEQRDFAQNLIETAPTIILVLDKDANIITFNSYFEKLTGRRPEEVRGKNWIDTFLPEENRPKIHKLFTAAISDISTQGNINPIITKTGQLRYIEWFDKALKDENGNITGLLSTGQDITERLKAEEGLKKAHAELEQRVEQRTAELRNTNIQLLKTIEERDRIQKVLQETEKLAGAGKLAAQIAHEINNPLAGIKNSFLLVKDAIPSNHQYFEYVGRIEKEINRVSQIVKQMFDLYRPGTTPSKRFRLYDTVKDITELLKVARQEKRINIEIDCDEKTTVTLPEALLRQVIYNIVQNAIQASAPDTTVKICAFANDGRLNLSVSDQGPGIDERIKDKIFEPFFTTGVGGPESGLGLGLAITKDIISAMNAEINFTSEKNKGTIFNISIPIESEVSNFKSAEADKSNLKESVR